MSFLAMNFTQQAKRLHILKPILPSVATERVSLVFHVRRLGIVFYPCIRECQHADW